MKISRKVKRSFDINRLFYWLKTGEQDTKLEERAKRSLQKWNRGKQCYCPRVMLYDNEPCENCGTPACHECLKASGSQKRTNKCLKSNA